MITNISQAFILTKKIVESKVTYNSDFGYHQRFKIYLLISFLRNPKYSHLTPIFLLQNIHLDSLPAHTNSIGYCVPVLNANFQDF